MSKLTKAIGEMKEAYYLAWEWVGHSDHYSDRYSAWHSARYSAWNSAIDSSWNSAIDSADYIDNKNAEVFLKVLKHE